MKRFSKKIVLAWFIFAPSFVYAGGGSIVGNPAGLAEQEVIYAYLRLPQVIDSCLETKNCELEDSELTLVKAVRALLEEPADLNKKIQFVAEKDLSACLGAPALESNRIAFTLLSPDAPICFNRDALYNDKGKPALEMPGFAAILFHELGHQVGELDHQYLDIIGAKLQNDLEKRKVYIEPPRLVDLAVTLYNASDIMTYSDTYLRIGEKSFSLTKKIITAISCPGMQTPTGFYYRNAHWREGTSLEGRWVFTSRMYYSCPPFVGEESIQASVDLNILVPSNAFDPKAELTLKSFPVVLQP